MTTPPTSIPQNSAFPAMQNQASYLRNTSNLGQPFVQGSTQQIPSSLPGVPYGNLQRASNLSIPMNTILSGGQHLPRGSQISPTGYVRQTGVGQ